MKPDGAYTREELRELMAARTRTARVPDSFQVITDTTDFHAVEYGDVVLLGGTPFWIRGFEREGRFGLDDEPKYWVRRAVDLASGATKVVKFVFREEFETQIGDLVIRRFRSPRKEARILDLVRDEPHFMHGRWVLDAAGNPVRILDFINGSRFDDIVADLGSDHRDYFLRHFPAMLSRFVELARAIKFLHDRGEKHGDIRRDHILWDRERGVDRWIDFDYDYLHGESLFSFDLQGLGNILIFLAGRGDVLLQDLRRERRDLFDALAPEDLNISFRNRVANLGKVYPYIPASLSRTLRHFSAGANLFYDDAGQLLEDMAEALSDVAGLAGRRT